MQVIPVLDILNGVVVHAVAGNRSRYQPVHSRLTTSADPHQMLQALRTEFGFDEFYVADLNSIQQQTLNRCTLAELARSQAALIVDRGVRCQEEITELLELDVARIVVALETLPDRQTATELLEEFGPQQLILSLDLKAGQPLTVNQAWQAMPPAAIAQELIQTGFQNLLVLDLADVGGGSGVSTEALCRQLRPWLSSGQLICGGGVSNANDLLRLQDAGIDAVLIASALHDGRIQTQDLQRLQPSV